VEEETTNKKPDNVSDNPGILPYGSNVGAPAIKLENLQNIFYLLGHQKWHKTYL